MADEADLSRRTLLATVGASTLPAVAGCNALPWGVENPETETVTFTDTTQRPTSTTRTTDEPGSPTATQTGEERFVFDGGDIEALHTAITTADREGIGTVEVETGTYRFEPRSSMGPGAIRGHVALEDVEDVTIEGNGSRFVFTDPLRAGLVFRGGGAITIRDLALDYDPVPFTQGTILSASMDERTVRLAVDEPFPTLDHDMFERADEVYALVHEADGAFISGYRKRGSWDPIITAIQSVGGGVYDLEINRGFHSGGLTEGRRLTVLARNNLAALNCYYVEGVTLESVAIHAANGAAFNLTVCRDPALESCVVAPPEDSDRHIGANADGIRIINGESSNRVVGCRHEYLGDDSLVIQNTMAPAAELIDDRTVAVENVHPFVVRRGDILQVMAPNGVRKGSLPEIEAYDPRFSSPGEREKPRTITFAESILDTLEAGDFLRNPATGSQHFEVRNNEFRHHRANLIRIAASHGIIEDNELAGCPINPIELETDTGGFFAPKGWTSDVIVRNNTIRDAGMEYFAGANPVGVNVHHVPAPESSSEGYPNRDITIANNDIQRTAKGGIHVEATRRVTIAGNTMASLNQMAFPGFADVAVSISQVDEATVRENAATGSADELTYFGLQRESSDVQATANSVTIDETESMGELVKLVPVRLAFSRTESPADQDSDNDDTRELAFRCRALRLVDETGSEIRSVDIGFDETGVSFGAGVFSPSSDGEWRWFGGGQQEAKLYFADSELAAATTLELRGYPFVENLDIDLYHGDERMDSVSIDESQTRWYAFDLG